MTTMVADVKKKQSKISSINLSPVYMIVLCHLEAGIRMLAMENNKAGENALESVPWKQNMPVG